ncbi:MAG TPA: HDOD domain-containing protein [Tepidisphaeraceae bacterium]|jgi:HD-like signal output (HDOD) protein
MNDILIQRIKQCPTLPSLPKVAIDILNLADDPDVALPELARIISQDPALVARILKTVNSSYYGLAHTVSSVDHALVVLGLAGVKTIVLGFSLLSDLKKAKPLGGFDHVAYWRRSTYAATAARIFAEEFKVPLVEEAFLAALLMDIGMLALEQVLGTEYAQVTSRAPSHAGLAPMEMAKLGLSHADVSASLAEHWHLPDVLAVPMAHHHKPQALEDSSVKDVAQVVWLAGRCADVFIDAQPEWSLCDVRRTCMERYKIDELACDAILCRIGMKTNELAPLFDVSMDGANTYETVLKRANEGLVKMTAALHEAPAAANEPSEKRRAPRFSRGGALPIFPYEGGRVGPMVRAQFRDASANGVGIALPFTMPPGRQFIIRLPQKGGESLPILYTVVRCDKQNETEHRVGAELTSVLRNHTLGEELNAAAVAAGKAEDGIERIRRAILASA